MSAERSIKAENQQLSQEIDRLRARIMELENQPVEPTKVSPDEPCQLAPAPVVPSLSYDARNPIAPGKDPYWDHVMAQKNRRRSWLD
jgi:hypothetical protein